MRANSDFGLVRVEEMYQLLFHLATMHELRGEYRLAEQILDERLRLPRAKDGAAVQIDSDTLLACSLFHQGEFSRAIERAENGVGLYDPQQHAGLIATYGENPAVACHGWAALSLWCLGYADQAIERVELSLELAGHPDLLFSLAGAKVRAANVYQLRRDLPQTLHWATEAADLAEEHGYLYASSFARALKGWALAMTGQPAEGLILVRKGWPFWIGSAPTWTVRICSHCCQRLPLRMANRPKHWHKSRRRSALCAKAGRTSTKRSFTGFAASWFSRPAAGQQRMKPKRISARLWKSRRSRKRGLSNCAPR